MRICINIPGPTPTEVHAVMWIIAGVSIFCFVLLLGLCIWVWYKGDISQKEKRWQKYSLWCLLFAVCFSVINVMLWEEHGRLLGLAYLVFSFASSGGLHLANNITPLSKESN